jgi:hypothetical protein
MKALRLVLFLLALVILTTLCKFYLGPDLDWSGFTPVYAICLIAGFIIKQRNLVFLFPLLSLFISDAIIQWLYLQNEFPYPGFYGGQWKNYLLLISLALIGWALKGRKPVHLAAGGFLAPTAFFLVSNFMVWQASTEALYPKSFEGLMSCYAAGLPFYKNALIATFIFLPLIVLVYNYMLKRKASLSLA